MATIAKYNYRELIIDELMPTTCRVCVIDEMGSSNLYIGRTDAKAAIRELEKFISLDKERQT